MTSWGPRGVTGRERQCTGARQGAQGAASWTNDGSSLGTPLSPRPILPRLLQWSPPVVYSLAPLRPAPGRGTVPMSVDLPAGPGADRNLLFGILALQLDFI